MNILIVYDSLYGNTATLAKEMAEELRGEQLRMVTAAEANATDVQNIQLLIAGTPTHGGQPSKPMTNFINRIPANALAHSKAAAFDTGIPVNHVSGFKRFIIRFIGYAAKRLGKALKSKAATVIAAETFFVLDREGPLQDGELQRSRKWARELISK